VINTSSGAHRFGHIDLHDMESARSYNAWRAYGSAKLMNILHASEINRRFRGVRGVSFHPGVVATGFAREGAWFVRVMYESVLRRLFMISPERGADTLVWLASTQEWTGRVLHPAQDGAHVARRWRRASGARTVGVERARGNCMTVEIREAHEDEHDALIPLLLQAEPSRRALRWSLENMSDAVYRLDIDGELAGAATMAWRRDPCEIVELAIAPELHGRGYGRAFVEWLAGEAKKRRRKSMIVGTSSTSAANILFYQKCGFRVADVRQDYFWYYDTPRMENGLVVRDMLVLEMRLV
jgi:N-acetylglutamate synthase-like GNAT family acetyltransferase